MQICEQMIIVSLNYQWDELLFNKGRFSSSNTEAIVRLAPNNSDVYMGHNTWTGFYSMLRLLKDRISFLNFLLRNKRCQFDEE